MVWIRLWISCIAFLSVAGGISFGMTRLAGSVRRDENPLLMRVKIVIRRMYAEEIGIIGSFHRFFMRMR